jgi:hypothetical protein
VADDQRNISALPLHTLCVECLNPREACECPQGFTDPEALAEYLGEFVKGDDA